MEVVYVLLETLVNFVLRHISGSLQERSNNLPSRERQLQGILAILFDVLQKFRVSTMAQNPGKLDTDLSVLDNL